MSEAVSRLFGRVSRYVSSLLVYIMRRINAVVPSGDSDYPCVQNSTKGDSTDKMLSESAIGACEIRSCSNLAFRIASRGSLGCRTECRINLPNVNPPKVFANLSSVFFLPFRGNNLMLKQLNLPILTILYCVLSHSRKPCIQMH
jgi:hypothetical protein